MPKAIQPLVTNREVAEILGRMATLLELRAENPYRVRAYENAARTVENLSTPLARLSTEELLDLPGIGKDLASKILDILLTGTFQAYEEIQREVKPEFFALMEIQGLGPKKLKQLIEQLGVQSVDDLEAAARAEKIRTLPGFGVQSELNILKAIEQHHQMRKRIARSVAEGYVDSLIEYLQRVKGVESVVAAGSYRRGKDTVGDLDILVTGTTDSPVMDAFIEYPGMEEIIGKGPTRSSIRLTSGLEVDLRFVPPESFGAALHYFTGSKAHNVEMRTLAKSLGLKINEYGVFRDDERIAGDTETSVFEAVGLPYIPPVLRENRGEIELAQKGQLPDLVGLIDLRGDPHNHTKASDGKNTIEEMVKNAVDDGLAYIGITDHSQSTARGLTPERFEEHLKAIDKVAHNFPEIKILKGVEVDILRDGSLDLPDELLARLDIVVASIHNYFNLDEEEQTERMLRAIRHPLVHVIGHPTARRIPDRPPIQLNLERVFETAGQVGTWMEINASPSRLDLNDELIFLAKGFGVKFVISTDSHQTKQSENRRLGVLMAQRGWLQKEHVINTLPVEKFVRALSAKRLALKR